jgi:hypothetical protein
MGCPECDRLSKLLEESAEKHSKLPDTDRLHLELKLFIAEMGSIRRAFLDHEATHHTDGDV